MAFWLTLVYLGVSKYNGLEMEWYFVFTLSLVSASIAVVVDKKMVKL